MGAVFIKNRVTLSDLQKAKEDYGDYIKVVIDVVGEKIAIGGQWHVDGEKLLVESGSKQNNIWGGGINLVSNQIDTYALINLKPGINDSQEILDSELRKKFKEIVKKKFGV